MTCRLRSIEEVAAWQLCTGCGACAYMNPARFEMVDTLDHGRRPIVRGNPDPDDSALDICPGIGLTRSSEEFPDGHLPELVAAWGPILELWEGHATDEEVRFAGSSGGVTTALGVGCVGELGMHGVLHIAARTDVPYLNRTVMSGSREELLAAAGSRYAPSSPCDGLANIERAPQKCAFIGKPCDVAAAREASRRRPALAEKLGLTIAIFCAGAPSTRGTLEMIHRFGIDDLASVRSVAYRGRGWPGRARVVVSGVDRDYSESYERSWAFLQRYRPWRCYICPDHTGEFADIAVSDPWYRQPDGKDPGTSLIVIRSMRGRRVFASLRNAGRITAKPVGPEVLIASHRHLLPSRGATWGRLATLRLSRTPSPTYRNISLFRFWWSELSLSQKLRSFGGTFRRILRKRLRAPIRIEAHPFAVDSATPIGHPSKSSETRE